MGIEQGAEFQATDANAHAQQETLWQQGTCPWTRMAMTDDATRRGSSTPCRSEDCVLDSHANARNVALAGQLHIIGKSQGACRLTLITKNAGTNVFMSMHKGCASRQCSSGHALLFGQHTVPGSPVELGSFRGKTIHCCRKRPAEIVYFVQPRHESHAFHAQAY